MSFTRDHLSPAQLEDAVPVCFYRLTSSGRVLHDDHPEAVAKRLKKG
ncbi:hypothetical protein [Rothia dentocariosa]|nr:hypothetical protein [Rothia dentocariosa]